MVVILGHSGGRYIIPVANLDLEDRNLNIPVAMLGY